MTERGQPLTSNGFGSWFKDRCREATLPYCSAHGLRKTGATLAAENGATDRQVMAMFGGRTSKLAEHYTRKAEQKRLAGGAMHLIDLDCLGSGSVPLLEAKRAGGTFSREIAMKSRIIPAIGAQERTRLACR
ncbi:tyrosine-type recombinase/integrase [Methylobacterium sp. OAE515]|uniref:tyrosine-type recombinase/integrase n=1 Tax=Methylobacterium sp. OAE515 TaxID=2817895 RepID=UPI0035A11C03